MTTAKATLRLGVRVINQDTVAPSSGLRIHGHRDVEVAKYVIEGELQHKDLPANGSVIGDGATAALKINLDSRVFAGLPSSKR